MKSASELLEFSERELEILADTVEQRLCSVRVIAQALLGHPQMQREGDEALLGAVVKVALKSSALSRASATSCVKSASRCSACGGK